MGWNWADENKWPLDPDTSGVERKGRKYDKGEPPRITPTSPPIGSPSAWLNGGVLGVDPPLHFLPSGSSAECLAPNTEEDPLLSLVFGLTVGIQADTIIGMGRLGLALSGSGGGLIGMPSYVTGCYARIVLTLQGSGVVSTTAGVAVTGRGSLPILLAGSGVVTVPTGAKGAGALTIHQLGSGVVTTGQVRVTGAASLPLALHGAAVVRETPRATGAASLPMTLHGAGLAGSVIVATGAGTTSLVLHGSGLVTVSAPSPTTVTGAGAVGVHLAGSAAVTAYSSTTAAGSGGVSLALAGAGTVTVGSTLYSLVFTGSGTYGSASDAGFPSGSDPWTVSCWAKTSVVGPSLSPEPFMLAWGTASYPNHRVGQTIAYNVAATNLRYDPYGTQLNGTTALAAGTWYHFAMVYDGSAVTLYVDGVADSSATAYGMGVILGGVCSVGSPFDNLGSSLYTWTGNIAEPAVFPSALTGSEIADLASGTTAPSAYSPVSYWPLTEGSGTTAADVSGNANTLTLVGGVTWSTDIPTEL